MAQKLLKAKKRKIVAKNSADGRAASMRPPQGAVASAAGRARAPREPRVVLVGTYRPGQLERWPDYYNYPLYKGEKLDPESCGRVNELWLFSGTKDQRTFRVECLGVKTREELVRDYGYTARGKGHGDGRYLLFRRVKELYVPAKGEAECVIVRTRDFAGQNKKGAIVQRQLKAYLESPDRKDPLCAKLLPTILTKLPPQTLRVCDSGIRMTAWSPVVGMTPQLEKIESIVMSIAAFGRNRAISAAKAYNYLSTHAGLDFLDEHYSITRCYSDEMMEESLTKVCRSHGGQLK